MTEYKTINEKGDFIEEGCIFEVDGELFIYSGVVHDEQDVYGYKISGIDRSEYKFKFKQVSQIYKPAIRL